MQLPVIDIVQEILLKMNTITPEQISEALEKISVLDGSYGILWGQLDVRSRQRDEIFLKLVEVQKKVLHFVQKLQSNPKHKEILGRLALSHQIRKAQLPEVNSE